MQKINFKFNRQNPEFINDCKFTFIKVNEFILDMFYLEQTSYSYTIFDGNTFAAITFGGNLVFENNFYSSSLIFKSD